MQLRPDALISRPAIEAGKHALVLDSGWASMTGALSGGVMLAAFALSLGAGPFAIGVLAAIPFISQVAQLGGIVLVERVRQRKKIAFWAVTLARVLIMSMATIPLLPDPRVQLGWLIGAQFLICLLGSIGGCAINSWLHQFLPADGLGRYFAKSLFFSTAMSCVGTLAVGYLVEHPPFGSALRSYAFVFGCAGITGFISSYYLVKAPEPVMHDRGQPEPLLVKLKAPFMHPNFRRLLILLGAWNMASNAAAPFVTVFLMRQLGFGFSTVTVLWVASQVSNALTLYLWGRISDRLSNKAILAVAIPAYFACTFGLVFCSIGESRNLQLALLTCLHIAMGATGGGIALATGNLGLKLAPQGQGTSYLAAIGLVSAIAGGAAPIFAGALAQWLSDSELAVLVRWASSKSVSEVSIVSFAHWEFLFALSALLGLYVIHALSRIEEGKDISERVVMQEIALEALHTVNQLSSIGGVIGSMFSFERFTERRLFRQGGAFRRRAGDSPLNH
jgi:MFS family permease